MRRNVAKVRVYELAKELGVESKILLNHLKEQGEFVRSASSTIEPPVVRKIRETFPAHLTSAGAPDAGAKAGAAPTAKKSAAKPGAAAAVAVTAVTAPEAPVAPPVQVAAVACLLYTSPSPRDRTSSRMPSSA